MKNILFILLPFLAFTACSDRKAVTDGLNRAEVLMDESPDSSLTLLRTLTFDDFRKESNRARYALLHSQALDKNYIDVTSDSLISVAVEYYKDEDDVRGKFLSYYYMGRVHANGERYLQATSCLMESEQLVEEVDDDYLSGLLYSEMGRIYRLYYDYPKSLEAHQKAAECYERAGMIRHRNYMWLNKSCVYRDMNRDDEGEGLLKKVLESAKAEDDATLIRSCLGDLVMLYIKQGKMKEARELYEKWESIVGLQSASSSFMAELALMYAEEGNFNQAQSFIQEGWKHVANRMDSVSLSLSSAKIHYIQGKGMAAYEEVVKGMSLQNRGIRQALQQPVLTAQRDYLSDRLEFQNYKLRMEKHLRVLYIVVFSLLLIIVVWWLLRKLKKTKENARKTIDGLHAEIQLKEQESHQKITSLLQELEQKSQSDVVIGNLKAELRWWDEHFRQYMKEVDRIQERQRTREKELTGLSGKLLASRAKLINVLLDCIYTDAETKDVVLQRLTLFSDQLMNDFGSGKKAYSELEQVVNECYDGIMTRIRSEVPLPDEASYRQVCYHLAGFSVKVIALMMGDTPNKIYKRRDRIRSKLESFKTDLL